MLVVEFYQRRGHVVLFFPREFTKKFSFEGIMVVRRWFRFVHNTVGSFGPDVIMIHRSSEWWLKISTN